MRINIKKEAEIARRLSHFLSAGQGIIESLDLLSFSYPFMKKVSLSVQSGQSLHNALKNDSGFSSISIKMIEVGEMTGTLSDSLAKLSTYLRHAHELRSKIISACTYPFIVSILSCSMISFLLFYIVPKILPVFESLKIDLPITTLFLIKLNYFISTNKIFLLITLVLLVGLIFTTIYIRRTRVLVLNFTNHIYGIRSIIQTIFLISFCRSMGIMLHSNVGVLHALSIISDSEKNPKYRLVIKKFNQHLREGKSFSAYMHAHPNIFGNTAPHFIEVGERTGGLSKSFIHFAEYLEYDFTALINRLTHLLEPALMIVLGFIVGFISLSLISPLYELSRISNV